MSGIGPQRPGTGERLLAPLLARRGAAVLDGGLATELPAYGVDLNDPLWSARALVDRPDAVAAVHRAYLGAGADIISSATYQATIPGLIAHGLTEPAALRILKSGVEIALRERDAFDGPRLVAVSIGSYGAFLGDGSEYRGRYGLGADALAAWHRDRLRILEASGADLIAFETIPSLDEARAIALLLAESDGPPAWVAFQTRDAANLADGAAIEAAVAAVEGVPRVLAVGVNCVAPALVTPLLARCAAATRKPLVAYPNRGGAWDAATKRWSIAEDELDFPALARAWRDAGARVIGGCCRTTPADIRAIASALE